MHRWDGSPVAVLPIKSPSPCRPNPSSFPLHPPPASPLLFVSFFLPTSSRRISELHRTMDSVVSSF
jgi:hypothetical protein